MQIQNRRHLPVVIMMDGNQKKKCMGLKKWFTTSRFLTYEAIDAFDVVEKLSDFTVESNPQIILLQVKSLRDEYGMIKSFVTESINSGYAPSIFTYSNDPKQPNSLTSIDQLQIKLNIILPIYETSVIARSAGQFSSQ